jgi:uncharacterized protein
MPPSTSFETLAASKYVSLMTVRKNGNRVSTPVWIAPAADGRKILYVLTMVGAGKLKRIRNNPSVELAPCTFRGTVRGVSVPASARILDPTQYEIADGSLTKKYPAAKRLLDLYHRLAGGRRTYLALKVES